jgi:hypothetical protein
MENNNYIQNTTSNSAPIENIFELGALLLGGLFTGKTIQNKVTDNQRCEILDKLPLQNLNWFSTMEMKNFFRNKKFYVTQFPDTHPGLFPDAVKILYSLLKYHGNRREDILLRWKLQFQIQKFIHKQRNIIRVKYSKWAEKNINNLLHHNPEWNLADFLNSSEIRNLIFGIKKDKRIDVAIYQAKMFGKIQNVEELKEENWALWNLNNYLNSNQFLLHIYDISWRDFNSLVKVIPDENFQLMDRNYIIEDENLKGLNFGNLIDNYKYDPQIVKNSIKYGLDKLTIESHEGPIQINSIGQLRGGQSGCQHASVLCALHILLSIDKRNEKSSLFIKSQEILGIEKNEYIEKLRNKPQDLYNIFTSKLNLHHKGGVDNLISSEIESPADLLENLTNGPIAANLAYFRNKQDVGHTLLLLAAVGNIKEPWIVAMDPDAEHEQGTGRFCLIKYDYIKEPNRWIFGHLIEPDILGD